MPIPAFPVPAGLTSLRRPPCVFDTVVDAFDAHTGKALVPILVACRVMLGPQHKPVRIKLTKGVSASVVVGSCTATFSIVVVATQDEIGYMRVDGSGGRPARASGVSPLVASMSGELRTPTGLFAYACGA
jgi:hypothetical protein